MAELVKNSVRKTLFKMAVPMLAGTFAMNAYNLTDTWFVSRLGTLPLAAMGFTFPVIMLLTCLAGGLGSGITTLVSHALGRKDRDEAGRFTVHGFAIVLAITMIILITGHLTINSVFSGLGADEDTLPLISGYMGIWYSGAFFMALPMVGNGILIAMGDSKSAGRFMMLGTVLNMFLDPIMIFGYLGFPAMGIKGAALATVISQAISTAWLFYLLRCKYRLLVFQKWSSSDYLSSARKIFKLGVPAIFSMILMPISASVITWILGRFGNEAVAACGAAGRIEMFAFVIPMALGISMMPFVSQNYGAGRTDRIEEAITLSSKFAVIYGGFIAIVFFISAPFLASIFATDPIVNKILQSYIRIISFGYGMMEVHRYCGLILNGLHLPSRAMLLNGLRVVVLLIPLSLLGAKMMGVEGVFWARLITDIMSGCAGFLLVKNTCRNIPSRLALN